MPNTFKVVKDAGEWVVQDAHGNRILAKRTFPSQDEAIHAAQQMLRGEGLGVVVDEDKDGNYTMTTFPGVSLPTEIRLTLPTPAAEALTRVLAKTGDKPGAVFGKALGLYLMALDAKDRGKVVGAADSADKLETEFTGF